ncbi:MAG TPA: FAD-dependent oxidoreductase, partial [Thermoplasmata archaeon]|nr:FAD-dependent oxidoreductase [Thermoplasmata archaeon]
MKSGSPVRSSTSLPHCMPSNDRYEIVIVGAGPMGLATAYHLAHARPGRSVLVVEALSGPGEGSMGASHSMVRDVFRSADNRRLASASIRSYEHVMESTETMRGPVPLLDRYGYLWLLSEPQRVEFESLLTDSMGTLDGRLLSLDEVGEIPGLERAPKRWFEGDAGGTPPAVTAAFFGRHCGALAPEMLARYYHGEARRLGVEFAFSTCVRRLSFEGREEILLHEDTHRPFGFQEHVPDRLKIAQVQFGDGRSVRADRVVVAAGAWSTQLLDPLGFATACSPRPQSSFSVAGRGVDELLDWTPRLDPIDLGGGRPRLPFVILPSGATLKPMFRERRLWLGLVDTTSRPI